MRITEEPAKTRTPAPSFSLLRTRSPRTWIWIAERLFLVAGLAALGLVAFDRVEADLYQYSQGRRLDMARARSGKTGAADGVDDAPVGRIAIRRLGLSVVVREGVDSNTLRLAAGHLPGSPFPGEAGNVVIAGHRDTFFRPLKGIHLNDVIEIATVSGVFRYRVTSTRVVLQDRTDVLDATDLPTLTLVTCFPFSFIGSAPKRFIVEARQIDPLPARSPEERGESVPANRPVQTTVRKAIADKRAHSSR